MTPAGLPHSEIPGSKRVCRSPRLIAACRVLHRRSAPRHPPFTLSSLAIKYLRREFTNRSFAPRIRDLFRMRLLRYASLLDSAVKDLPRGLEARGEARGRRLPSFAPSGADRDRTDDLRLAKPPLSQLSYSPTRRKHWWAWIDLNYRPHAYQACALTN